MIKKKYTAQQLDDAVLGLIRKGLIVPNGKFRNGQPVYVTAPGLTREKARAIHAGADDKQNGPSEAPRPLMNFGDQPLIRS